MQRNEKKDNQGSNKDDEIGEKEKEAVKERYLGALKRKKRIRRMNDRKFVFDWDAGEDTSHDYNPIYNDKHGIQFYGRGCIGGIDEKEQKKSSFYGDLIEQRRTDTEKVGFFVFKGQLILKCLLRVIISIKNISEEIRDLTAYYITVKFTWKVKGHKTDIRRT